MSIASKASNSKLFIPQLGDVYVHRERLTDILHSNIQKRLQVISAPAGYGKTTLLADFAHSVDVPVCWYSIDEDDADPALLLDGVLASISSRFSVFSKVTASQLAATDNVIKDASHLLASLSNEINDTIPDYMILVLEDYHVIEHSEPAKSLLNLLLDNIPENCHLIISSRTRVDLPAIPRLIMRNQTSILASLELSFTASEVQRLAAACFRRKLPSRDAKKVVEDTGGWPIGILLLLGSAIPSEQVRLSEVNQGQVFSYMTAEVFERQTLEMQRFLLASSTVYDIRFEFLEQLIPGANCRKAMNDLERQNLFIQRVDDKGGCFRYHQLFRDFLQEKLRHDDPVQFSLLHFKAASLYEQECQWSEAVSHYHRSKRYQQIAQVIKEAGRDLLKAGKWSSVHNWLNLLPINLRRGNSELTLLEAQCLIRLGNLDGAAKLLGDLLGRLSGDADWLWKAEALSWRGAVFRLTGNLQEAKANVSLAIRVLNEHHGPAELLGACHRRVGDIYKDQGRFPSALRHLRLAQRYYNSVFDIGALASVHNSLGVTYKRLGQLTRAKIHFEKARAGWAKTGNLGALAAALNNIGIIYQRLGQNDQALETLRSGLDKAREVAYRPLEAVIHLSIADVLRDLGLFEGALRYYNEGLELARQLLETSYVAYAIAGLGDTYRLLGQYDKSRIMLEEARLQAEEQKQSYEMALFDTQIGIIDYETGQIERAKVRLSDAGKRLQTIGDKDALAKVYFHLAQASFLSRDYDAAVIWMEKTSKLADELGYDNFLVIEGRNALPLVHHGAAMRIGNGRFVGVLERIRALKEKKEPGDAACMARNQSARNKYDIEARAFDATEITVYNRRVKEVDWRSNRAKEIFFFLLSHRRGKTREQITEALWPDLSQAKGSSNFHINLFRARRALFPEVFILEGGKYRVNSDLHIWFDVEEFERLVLSTDSTKQNDNDGDTLERAVELYRGPFLVEFFTDWTEVRRRELENAYLKTLSLLADYHAKRGNHSKAVVLLEKSIAVDPYQEDTYYRIMRLYADGKNKPLALRTYQDYIKTVAAEKLPDISPDLKNLYQELLIGEASSRRED